MSQHRYLENRSAEGASRGGWPEVLRFLDSLNEVEWHDLVGDLICEDSRTLNFFRPSRGFGVLPKAVKAIRACGSITRELMSKAAVNHAELLVTQGQDSESSSALSDCLFLMLSAPDHTSYRFLVSLVKRNAVAESTRVLAAKILAVDYKLFLPAYKHVLREDFDPSQDRWLFETLLAERGDRDPWGALGLATAWSDADSSPDIAKLTPTLDGVFKELAGTPSGRCELTGARDNGPEWLRRAIDGFLKTGTSASLVEVPEEQQHGSPGRRKSAVLPPLSERLTPRYSVPDRLTDLLGVTAIGGEN